MVLAVEATPQTAAVKKSVEGAEVAKQKQRQQPMNLRGEEIKPVASAVYKGVCEILWEHYLGRLLLLIWSTRCVVQAKGLSRLNIFRNSISISH